MKQGKMIVIEGAGDGMGKSTQLSLLKDRIKKDGEDFFYHHFPTYNTYQGRPVEEYLNGNFGSAAKQSPYFVHLLYAQDRAITWHTQLKYEYELGKTLLMDRYTTSTFLYQAANIEDISERKAFIDFACDYEYNKLGIKEPDKILFLYASFELITKLRNQRQQNEGILNDIHERDLDFMKRVYDNAMFVADYLSWDMINCEKNGEMRTREDIHEEVYKLVKEKRRV